MRYWLVLCTVLLTTLGRTEGAGEFSGFVAANLRVFFEAPQFAAQKDTPVVPSLLVQPEYRYAWNNGNDRFTIVPFARLEENDARRRHFDLRELHWLHIGASWDVVFGVSKVFWGVTESVHLVDIINQTDLVEDPDMEDKLGQPMLKFTLLNDWGTLTLFALPRFRERTFPGSPGRLRSALVVDTDEAVFDSPLKVWHPDAALRWTHTFGAWDVGVAHFSGTSREPRLLPRLDGRGRLVLIPHYDLIHQTSLDVQFTLESWLGKLEVITRDGHGGRFAALAAGFEYTFFGVFGTAIDLGVLAEYLYDGRSDAASPTPFEDDIFVGLRLAFNDTQSTHLLAGTIVDRTSLATFVSVEGRRRLSDHWTIELEIRAFINIAVTDTVSSGFRRDDYMQIRLARYF